MTDLDKMARELLAAECRRIGANSAMALEQAALAAIRTALLTAPPGYVLVPVEPTGEMLRAALRVDLSKYGKRATLRICGARAWAAMLAAAPEPK